MVSTAVCPNSVQCTKRTRNLGIPLLTVSDVESDLVALSIDDYASSGRALDGFSPVRTAQVATTFGRGSDPMRLAADDQVARPASPSAAFTAQAAAAVAPADSVAEFNAYVAREDARAERCVRSREGPGSARFADDGRRSSRTGRHGKRPRMPICLSAFVRRPKTLRFSKPCTRRSIERTT